MAWRARQLRVLTRTLRTQARYDYLPQEDLGEPSYIRPAGVATPRQVHIQLIPSCETSGSRLSTVCFAMHSWFNTWTSLSLDRRMLRRCYRLRAYKSRLNPSRPSLRGWNDSVFNHYNRVRANLLTMESDEDDTDWPDASVDDGTF